MIRNFFKIGWRNLSRNKLLFAINTAGLALGIATCLTIALFVMDEHSYDRHHSQAERIVRVTIDAKIAEESIREANVMAPVAQVFKEELPEVEEAARFLKISDRTLVKRDGEAFRSGLMVLADPALFQIFDLPLLEGDPRTALSHPRGLVLTTRQAELYFGDEEPMGQTLSLGDIGTYEDGEYRDFSGDYVVTGIMEPQPETSHFHFDLMAPLSVNPGAEGSSWLSGSYYTYLLMRPDTDLGLTETKLDELTRKYMGPQLKAGLGMDYDEFHTKGNAVAFRLQPLTDIHLYSEVSAELEPGGNSATVYIFSAIALFMLLIACINFMNLSTAGASRRIKEIGLRKVVGSRQNHLVYQFLTEAFLLTLVAMVLGIALCVTALPFFNALSGKNYEGMQLLQPGVLVFLAGLTLLITVLSGGYPAFYMSRFRPVHALKKGFRPNGKKSLRGGLVVFQFAISICLIIATLVVSAQMKYIRDKDLGYDRESVLVVRNAGLLGADQDAFRTELQRDSRIEHITKSAYLPAGPSDNSIATIQSRRDPELTLRTNVYHVDEEYLPTLGMELLAGRNFSPEFGKEEGHVIVNETAVSRIGLGPDPIGKTFVEHADLEGGRTPLTVIGLVRDFHARSLHEPIEPLIMRYNPYTGIILRTRTTDLPGLIADLGAHWDTFETGEPFTYDFLDTLYSETYVKETRMNAVLRIFALLTIFVACLGLFGLVTFTAQRRVKEIGIRKVLGSSVFSIVQMLSREFLRPVLLAMVIAFPLGYYLMEQWLRDFAYRIQIEWWMFLVTGIITLLIALITTGYQSLMAAMANPVNSLRTE